MTSQHQEILNDEWIGAIDEGTTSARFFIFDKHGNIVSQAREEIPLITPQAGWVEQDPIGIINSVNSCISRVVQDIYSRFDTSNISEILKGMNEH